MSFSIHVVWCVILAFHCMCNFVPSSSTTLFYPGKNFQWKKCRTTAWAQFSIFLSQKAFSFWSFSFWTWWTFPVIPTQKNKAHSCLRFSSCLFHTKTATVVQTIRFFAIRTSLCVDGTCVQVPVTSSLFRLWSIEKWLKDKTMMVFFSNFNFDLICGMNYKSEEKIWKLSSPELVLRWVSKAPAPLVRDPSWRYGHVNILKHRQRRHWEILMQNFCVSL